MPDSNQEPCFVDTNLWLYAFIESEDSAKSRRARALIQDSNVIISVQVVNKVCFNLLRKAKFTNEQIVQLIESFFAKYQVIDLTRDNLIAATQLRTRYSLSFWDSMIIAAARRSNAAILYSEDLQDGLVIDGTLRIVNPLIQH